MRELFCFSWLARLLDALPPALWGGVGLLWGGALAYLSHGALPEMANSPFEIPHLDKVVHFGYFGLGGVAFERAVGSRWSAMGWLLAAAGVLFALLGALDEYHQSFFANRSGNDPGDWFADVLGALTGVFLSRRLR